jgi:hypothetical protein
LNKKIYTLILLLCLLISAPNYLLAQSPINPKMALKIFDIYSKKFEEAQKQNKTSSLKVILKSITKYSIKLEKLSHNKALTKTQLEEINKRLELTKEYENKLSEIIKPSSKKQKKSALALPKPKGSSSMDYNSTTGTIFGVSAAWHPDFFKTNELENNSQIQLTDSAMNNVTYQTDNRFKFESLPLHFNLSGFIDRGDSSNNNSQVDFGGENKIDIFGIKEADLKSNMQIRLANKQNNGQLSLRASKAIGTGTLNGSYIMNVSEVGNSGYHQLASSYKLPNSNLWGFEHSQNTSGRLTLFPSNGVSNTLYMGWNNQLKKDKSFINSQLLLNYLPENPNATYLGFNNTYKLNEKFGSFTSLAANVDIKNSTNTATSYNRLGSNVSLPLIEESEYSINSNIGIDFYNFSNNTSSYSTYFFQLNSIDQRPTSLLSNYNCRLGRRSYPKLTNSAWTLDFSTSEEVSFFDTMKMQGLFSANYVKFDTSSAVQTDSFSLNSGLQQAHKLTKDHVLMTNYNIAWLLYFQSWASNTFIITINSSIQF